MPSVGTAYLDVRGNFGPLRTGLRRSQYETERTLGKMESKASQTFKNIAKVAAVGIGAGALVGTKKAVNAAVDLGEQVNKTRVVFRNGAKDVLDFGESTANSLGISNRAALEAAGTFGNMLVPMGFARKEAGKMSTRLVELAADMASFNNATPEETLDALRAGLAGETEPLRRFGVFLNEARIEAEALSSGIVKTSKDTGAIEAAQLKAEVAQSKYNKAVKEHGKNSTEAKTARAGLIAAEGRLEKATQGSTEKLTAAQKAQATYALILKDTKDSQGDFARTSDSLANQQRTIKAQFEDTAASLGTALLPALTKAAGALTDFVGDVNKVLSDDKLTGEQKFERIGDMIGNAVRDGLQLAAEAAGRFGPRIASELVKGFIQAPALIQLLAGAWVFAKGRKLLTAFGLLGTQAGGAFGAGVGAGAAGGAAAGGAGGAAAGGLAGLATRLRAVLPRLGFAAVGIGAADLILNSVEARLDARSKDLDERLKGLAATPELDALSKFGGPPGGLVAGAIKPLFTGDDQRGAERLKEILKDVQDRRRGITAEAAREATQIARNLDLTRQQRAEIQRQLDLGVSRKGGSEILTNIARQLNEAKRITPGLINSISAQLESLPAKTRPKFAQMVLDAATELKRTGKIKGSLQDLKNVISAEVDGVGNLSIKGPKRLKDKMAAGFEAMLQAVADPTSRMASTVQAYLEAFGAGGIGKIAAAISRDKRNRETHGRSSLITRGKPFSSGLAQGGFLSGPGKRDTIPIMAAPGEAVLNRHQQQPVETALRTTYGFGLRDLFRKERKPHYMAQGGFVAPQKFARGGMVTGDLDMGRALLEALRRMAKGTGQNIFVREGGRTLAEQRQRYATFLAGGNLAAKPTPNAPHVRGVAADITPGREVFGSAAGRYGMGFTVPSESWHIEILSGKGGRVADGGGGGGAPPIPDLGRVEIKGRDSVAKSLARAATSKVRDAAQKFMERQAAKAAPTGEDGPTDFSDVQGSGAELMRQISKQEGWNFGHWWEIDARESSHGANLVNPDSTARLRGQFLDKNWGKYGIGSDPRKNPSMRQQIISMAQYIKERYGNPTKALAFHNAHNWYRRGGFVDGLPAFAAGGPTFRAEVQQAKKPKGVKAPPKGGPSPGPGYKWDASANKWVRKKGKGKRKGGPYRSLPEINPDEGLLRLLDPLEEQLHRAIPSAEERIQDLESTFSLSDYEPYPDQRIVPRLRREGHNIQQIGDSFIDWSAVEQRKSELTRLLGEQFGLIGTPFGAGKGLMEAVRDKLDPLKDQINALVTRYTKEVDEIKRQVRENMRKHARNEKRIETLDKRIDEERGQEKPDHGKIVGWREDIRDEQKKKRPNQGKIRSWQRAIEKEQDKGRDPGKIRAWEDEKRALSEENEDLRRANRRLTGESQPSGELSAFDQPDQGELGKRQAVLASAKESLEHVAADREGLVGFSGVGGDFASAKNAIAERMKELGTLSTERIKEGVAGGAEAEQNRDIRAFIDAITSLQRQFGGNFKPLSFEGGGRVEAPLGAPVNATVHGGELIVDPRTGALQVKVVGGEMGGKTVNIVNHFKTTPEDTHSWSRQMEWDVRTAV